MTLKKKILSRQLSVGSWITLGHPSVAEIMARAGFEWLVVDLEHSCITLDQAENLIRTIELNGSVPLVRLTSNDSDLIKRVMDSGAHGVICPMVNSKREAEELLASVYYPPRGKRGVGLARAQRHGAAFHPYRDWLDQEAVVIAQIEHKDGARNAEEILSVDGIDGYILGPFDLSASLGRPGDFEHPEVVSAIQHVKNIADKLSKVGGIHIIEPQVSELERRVKEGFTFLAYSIDIRILDCESQAGVRAAKELRNE